MAPAVDVDAVVDVDVDVPLRGVPGVGTTSSLVLPCRWMGLVGPDLPLTLRLDSTTISSNAGINADLFGVAVGA